MAKESGSTKSVNHTVFAEKLLHRFLLETYYRTWTKKSSTYQNHLPKIHKQKTVNVVVPEESHAGVRPDLEIYFKEEEKGIPVEVKWDINDAHKSPNQIEYIYDNGGFYVSFTSPNDNFSERKTNSEFTKTIREKLNKVDKVIIQRKDFNDWFTTQYPLLLSNQDIGLNPINKKRWLVVQRAWNSRGDSKENWDKMIEKSGEKSVKGFWAFEQKSTGKAVKHCLNMRKGDEVLFCFVKAQSTQISRNPSNVTHVEKAYLCELTSDYFIDKNNVFEKIFEGKNSTLNEDRWPHFVKFKYLRETIEMLEFKVPSHLDSSFADSFNSGVKPIPISEQDITKLCGILKMVPFKKIH